MARCQNRTGTKIEKYPKAEGHGHVIKSRAIGTNVASMHPSVISQNFQYISLKLSKGQASDKIRCRCCVRHSEELVWHVWNPVSDGLIIDENWLTAKAFGMSSPEFHIQPSEKWWSLFVLPIAENLAWLCKYVARALAQAEMRQIATIFVKSHYYNIHLHGTK